MNVITRAIEKNFHKCGEVLIESQTWNQFYDCCREKKVFVWGSGNALDYVLKLYGYNIEIEGFIDEDKRKQGCTLGWYCAEAENTKYENFHVLSPEILGAYPSEEIAVLVTSTKYYPEIIQKLKGQGIENTFSLLTMENNNAEKENYSDAADRDAYVEACCHKEVFPDKIVMSYGDYGEHIRYITKQLLAAGKKLDIVWLINSEKEKVPEGVRAVPIKNRKRYTYEMETAKVWIFDIEVARYIVKRPEQYYIQVKHWSSITLKRFYLQDQSVFKNENDFEHIRYNGKIMDYIFSGSKFDEEACDAGFAFQGKYLRIGSARSDILFDEHIKETVYKKLNLPLHQKTLLYAPTFRIKDYRNGGKMNISMDLEALRAALKQKDGNDWTILVRLHPIMNSDKSNITETEFVKNVSDYPDGEELVAASDMMITDYSSIMFEMAFVKRPVFLYAPDRNEYIGGERTFLLDYDQLPFPTAETNESLVKNILMFDEKEYTENITQFLDYHEVCEDGHASERAAKFILKIMEPKES